MCDILKNVRREYHEIKLEKYGSVIAAPKMNVYMLCCIHCQSLFHTMEVFIQHIKLMHTQSTRNISVQMDKAISVEDGGRTARQIIASKRITLLQDEHTELTDMHANASSLQPNDFPQELNEQNCLEVVDEEMQSDIRKEQCLEDQLEAYWIDREDFSEPPTIAVNRGVEVQCDSRQEQFEFEDCCEISSEDEEPQCIVEKQQNYDKASTEVPSTILDKDTAKSTGLVNKSNKLKIHPSPDVYKCTHCYYSTNQSYNLWKHKRDMKHSHLPLKPYKCDICHKLFDIKLKLTVHRKFHFCK